MLRGWWRGLTGQSSVQDMDQLQMVKFQAQVLIFNAVLWHGLAVNS
jgi:hypothetical protein